MGALYLGALVVGLGILLLQIAMSSSKDVDVGGKDIDFANAHLDIQADASTDVDGDSHHAGGHVAGVAALFLSFRFWTFALAGFGMFGTGLHYGGLSSSTLTLVLSLALGLAAGLAASWSFRTLQDSSVNSGADVKELVGQVGKVLLPPNSSGRAKVRLLVKGQMIDYVATSDDPELQLGASVLVEEVRGNQVHVSSAPSGLKYPGED